MRTPSPYRSSTARRVRPALTAVGGAVLEERRLLTPGYVTYFGGPLIDNVQVVPVYYGQQWGADPELQAQAAMIDQYFQYITSSSLINLLGQYSVSGQTIGPGSFLEDAFLTGPTSPAPNTEVGDSPSDPGSSPSIQSALSAAITNQTIPAPNGNILYFVFTPPNVVVSQQGATSDEPSGFTSYHGEFPSPLGGEAYYAVVADPIGNYQLPGLTTPQAQTESASHELSESITDPIPSFDTGVGGWTGPYGEIADLAEGHYVFLNGYAIQEIYSNTLGVPVAPNGSTTTDPANDLSANGETLAASTQNTVSGTVAVFNENDGSPLPVDYYATIDWGDGTTTTGTIQPDPNGGFDVEGSHTYSASPLGEVVTTSIVDLVNDNTTAAQSQVASVEAPLTASGVDFDAVAGVNFSGLVATFNSNDSTPDFSATIDWGDGTVTSGTVAPDPGGGFDVNGTHTYAQPGSNTVTVSIVDNEGAPTIASGAALVAGPPGSPTLSAQSNTGDTPGLTRFNGSTAAPLTFNVGGVSPASGFVQLWDVTDGAAPVALGKPVQATGGTATITLAGTPLTDGTHQVAATLALTAGGAASALFSPSAITIQSSLHVIAVSPSSQFLTSLPGNEVVVTFNHDLAGLVPDEADGGGFASDPFAVALIPSGPGGASAAANGTPLWTAPSGYDGGDLPVPATAVYHEDPDGTSTITLTPHQPLSTDIYLIAVSGVSDRAGNVLTDLNGNPGPFYASFDLRPASPNSLPPQVVAVTTEEGAVPIRNNAIPQPDTIGIAFSKPLDPWTVNTNTIQLTAQVGPGSYTAVRSAVAYSPSTQSAYLTPETDLTPGTVYLVAVEGSVTDDEGFPSPGVPLGQPFYTTFTVSGPGLGAGRSPLTLTATDPRDDSAWTGPLGYVSATFSEPINLAAEGRFSVMLIPQTGGATTGGSGYADVPVNAALAFNPNTDQLIIVPTKPLLDDTVYLDAFSGIEGTNGDPLTNPGGGLPVYASFLLNSGAPAQALRATASAADLVAVSASEPSSRPVQGGAGGYGLGNRSRTPSGPRAELRRRTAPPRPPQFMRGAS